MAFNNVKIIFYFIISFIGIKCFYNMASNDNYYYYNYKNKSVTFMDILDTFDNNKIDYYGPNDVSVIISFICGILIGIFNSFMILQLSRYSLNINDSQLHNDILNIIYIVMLNFIFQYFLDIIIYMYFKPTKKIFVILGLPIGLYIAIYILSYI